MKHIVKRHGSKEIYDEKKLYASVYASCLNAHHDEPTAEKMAQNVTDQVNDWLGDRNEVSSHELKKRATAILDDIDSDVALLYHTFLDLC